jgi:hypothetical protein
MLPLGFFLSINAERNCGEQSFPGIENGLLVLTVTNVYVGIDRFIPGINGPETSLFCMTGRCTALGFRIATVEGLRR